MPKEVCQDHSAGSHFSEKLSSQGSQVVKLRENRPKVAYKRGQ